MFSLPSDHWTWIAVQEMPWPDDDYGYVACCGRCGQLRDSPRVTYAASWADAMAHHRLYGGLTMLPDPPDTQRGLRGTQR